MDSSSLSPSTLSAVGDGVWTIVRPMKFWHVECGTRMTVVRLADGGLFVHSPVALDSATKATVDALGPVKAVACASKFHHMFVREWLDAYPDALACACPGLAEKRPDVRWDRVLGDVPDDAWKGDLEQVFFGARTMENEVVFFHARSRTLVCCDIVFNFATHPSRVTRLVARLLANREPGATWLEHVMMRDRAAAKEQLGRMLAWDFDRILLAHGAPIERGGRDVLRRAYAWL